MGNIDQENINFPRVTRHRVVNGRRVATSPSQVQQSSFRTRLSEISEELEHRLSVHFQWIGGTSWKVLSGILGGTAFVCSAMVLGFGAKTGEANAATTEVTAAKSGITSGYITGRDRVLVGKDGDLRAALLKAAVAPSEIDSIIAVATGAGVSDKLTPGLPIDLAFSGRTADDAYRAIQMATFRPAFGIAIEVTRENGELKGKFRKLKVDPTPLRIYGVFGSDVRGTLIAAGIPQYAADQYLGVLKQHVDTGTIKSGHRYDIIVEQETAETGERRLGNLIYAGLYQDDGISLQLSQWTLKGQLRWFDYEEASQSHDNIQRPVPGVVSSNYGNRRHPILGYTRMHKGMDFKAGYGTPILAVQTGWVEFAGWHSGGYGNQVELKHGAGLSTTYSHMSQVSVRDGQLVQQGQVIGYVGSTGLSTGPHLHYELHQNGQAIDPGSVKFTMGPQLRGKDLEGYKARLNALLKVPAAKPLAVQMAAR